MAPLPGSPTTSMRLCTPPRWLLGSAHRQPLSLVQFSSATQMPVHVMGVLCRNVLSWCGTTSPPMLGCLKMYMDCTGVGSVMPMERIMPLTLVEREKAAKVGSRSCMACPILFRLNPLACFSTLAPLLSSNAFSSKKNDTWLPLSRKYSSVFSFWLVVLKMDTVDGSNDSTSSSARASIAATSGALAKFSSTRKPSAWNWVSCSGVRA
mmetsp:Transcript_26347/g.64712  ORF Transcript_26347/g.64712 Transcript_26347/m.64712 type:complete len:208 (-) Transcript_26347:240-863(-)